MKKPRKRRVLTRTDEDEGNVRYIDLELRNPELIAIGHVTTQWAFLESLILTHCVALQRKVGEEDRNIRSDSFRRRMRAWRDLTKRVYKELPDILTIALAIIEDAARLSHRRHELIHGDIEWDKRNTNVLHFFTKDGKSSHIDQKQIARIAFDISKISYRIVSLHGAPQIVQGAKPRV